MVEREVVEEDIGRKYEILFSDIKLLLMSHDCHMTKNHHHHHLMNSFSFSEPCLVLELDPHTWNGGMGVWV